MADTDVDPAVRIVVTPSQSSYFAGEPFSVTITFTNTRSPEPGPSSRALSHPHTHKRNAHSISSAPISRPPTSPGTPRTPRTAMPTTPSRAARDSVPGRKGLIGRTSASPTLPPATSGSLPALVEQRRKKMLAKSLSVSIVPPDLDSPTRNGGVHTPRSASFFPESPISPLPTSLSRRSDTLPLAASHPHARKHSVAEGAAQVQLQEIVASPTSPGAYTPSASSSTFSLALDPIAESSAGFPYPPPPGPDAPPDTPMPTTPGGTRAYPPRRASAAAATRQADLGHGRPPPAAPPPLPIPPRMGAGAHSAPFPHPPHTELLLYAYASLTGRAVLAPLAGAGTLTLSTLRAALSRPARGGGSLSIQAAGGVGVGVGGVGLGAGAGAGTGGRHRRASSFSAGLRALGAGIWGRSTSGGAPGGGAPGSGDGEEGEGDADPEAPLPTLEVAPEMLAVDLSLAPGESRSYTYTLLLPANLPPTFKGRTLRFSYEFTVGACRAASTGAGSVGWGRSSGGGGGGGSVSRVMKVPIRVYNHVAVGRAVRPYDLRWPVARRIASPAHGAQGSENLRARVEERRPGAAFSTAVPGSSFVAAQMQTKQQQQHGLGKQEGGVEELGRYATRLLAAASGSVGVGFGEGDGEGEEGLGVGGGDSGRGEGGGGGLSGCREAVEVLTRNLKKVSYDITKDSVTVAVLTFPKSAFRLGETVHGVVEVNWREGRGRVLQLTAFLEAHESLPVALATPPSTPTTARYLRRVHAEHHARFVLGTLRLGFALDIPSDGSPAFGVVASGTEGTSNNGAGGLEWRVRLCLLVSVAAEASDVGTEGVRAKGLMRDAEDDGGRGAWGSAWRAPARLGVLERTPPPPPQSPVVAEKEKPSGWGSFLAASFLGGREGGYHDGDDFDDESGEGGSAAEEAYGYDGVKSDMAGGVGVGVRYGGREDGWTEVRAEMVECVVPVRVWAGNTAFRAGDVVFDV
ncbi:Rgp1-domain-containing protein [Mycena galericulata]|nr:Rgp1-domain-containing protein [Mycena galericulata]